MVFFFFSTLALAQCSRDFAAVHFDAFVIEKKLEAHPYVSSLVMDVMADPKVPGSVKRVLSALESKSTFVVKLDESFRKEFDFPESFEAGLLTRNQPSNWSFTVNKSAPVSVNTRQSLRKTEKAPYPYQDGNTVHVGDEAITFERNDFVNLVHELAHVRFRKLFPYILERYHSKFPSDLISKRTDGTFGVNEQLFHYLNERYAFESGLRGLRSTHERYYGAWLEEYRIERGMTDAQARELVADRVAYRYGITDPRLHQANGRSLRSILMEGLPVDPKGE